MYWRPCSRNDSHKDALAHIEQMRWSVVSILVAVSIQLGWAIQPGTSLHDDIFDQSTYACNANISLFVSVPQHNPTWLDRAPFWTTSNVLLLCQYWNFVQENYVFWVQYTASGLVRLVGCMSSSSDLLTPSQLQKTCVHQDGLRLDHMITPIVEISRPSALQLIDHFDGFRHYVGCRDYESFRDQGNHFHV